MSYYVVDFGKTPTHPLPFTPPLQTATSSAFVSPTLPIPSMLLSKPARYQIQFSFQLPIVKSPNFWTLLLFVSAFSSLLLRNTAALTQPLGLIPLTQAACLCGSLPCSSLSSHHRPVLWLHRTLNTFSPHMPHNPATLLSYHPIYFSISPRPPTTETLLLLSSSNLIYYSHVPTGSFLFGWAPTCVLFALYTHYILWRVLLFINAEAGQYVSPLSTALKL